MGDRIVSKIVDELSTAIWDTMQPFYLPQPSTEMWETIARRFDERWQFPHCNGAQDGKHIMIKKPAKSGSSFFSYKQTFTVVLMATVTAAYKFITIDVGFKTSQHARSKLCPEHCVAQAKAGVELGCPALAPDALPLSQCAPGLKQLSILTIKPTFVRQDKMRSCYS